jgi:hypothetical protein
MRALPGLAVVAVAWLALFPITSVDAYYHLATGRRILDTGSIPDRGVGSATFGRAPWHDNEWGFQVLAALVGRTARDADGVVVLTPAGRIGLILLRAGALAATLALLSAQMARAGVGPVLRALGVLLAAFLTFGNLFWDVRPQILSYLAFVAIAYLLERARDGTPWALPAAVGVVAAWANVHGAFVLGIALLGAEAAGAWIDVLLGRGAPGEARRLTLAAALAPAAACLNPLGWRQLVHPFLYLARPEIYAGNNEWTRPDLAHLPLLLATFAALGLALVAGGRPRSALAVRVLLFAALFTTAIRHLPLVALATVPVLAAALSQASAGRGWRRYLDPAGDAWGGMLRRAAAALAIAAGIVLLSGAKFVSPVPSFTERPSRPLPEGEVRFLARHAFEGSGFNAYRFGGFLMLRLYPAEPVFMDGRNDLYGTFRTETYLPILEAEPGWEPLWRDAVARYRVAWVLIDDADPLAAALDRDAGWRRVSASELGRAGRSPDGIVLFVRSALLASSAASGRS